MSFWTAAVIIVAIWGFVQIYRSRQGILSDKHGNQSLAHRDNPATDAELEELRERVKVLEKITVDGREARAIADEIESLRSKPDKQDG
ncbi:hypothetical protein BPTFM16_00046 [Altererythrobacter insulae]|nr:hypothetical protein BPTFM16_00046 [Altererythrobacter insulae]